MFIVDVPAKVLGDLLGDKWQVRQSGHHKEHGLWMLRDFDFSGIWDEANRDLTIPDEAEDFSVIGHGCGGGQEGQGSLLVACN